MNVSDYIVEFLISKGITDVFGYPGGMVTFLMDSFFRHSNQISSHVTYHEQGAAFAACGYAQASGKAGVAYATSGPGATNLITGICNAYFDSIPSIFITGQVNSNEAKGAYGVRQRGFQETDIVSIIKPVTKYAVYADNADAIPAELEKAYQTAMSGRKGPVLLDVPMNVFKAEIKADVLEESNVAKDENLKSDTGSIIELLSSALLSASAPVFLIGCGLKFGGVEDQIRKELNRLRVPIVSSMTAFDVMRASPYYYGFIGAYGSRTANFVAAKCDLLIALGTRMDIRQVGFQRGNFAPDAQVIRFDIDKGELEYRVHKDEIQVCADLTSVADALERINLHKSFQPWISLCNRMKRLLCNIDDNPVNRMVRKLSAQVPDGAVITTDVGQNQVWVAQSFQMKPNQKVLFSGGHGAMGYSLPAAIGACYASGKKQVYCFTGDGGIQMNIQELQLIAREHLPIKIVVFNNNALGMIRHFQEMYFASRYFQTKPEGGYTAPNFSMIAGAYGIRSQRVQESEISGIRWHKGPELLEVMIEEDTYVTPKLAFGNPNQDQEPLLDRDLYHQIMDLRVDDFISPNQA